MQITIWDVRTLAKWIQSMNSHSKEEIVRIFLDESNTVFGHFYKSMVQMNWAEVTRIKLRELKPKGLINRSKTNNLYVENVVHVTLSLIWMQWSYLIESLPTFSSIHLTDQYRKELKVLYINSINKNSDFRKAKEEVRRRSNFE